MTHRFTTNRVQVWQLIGLTCWHRTLIRQQVDWIRRSARSIEGSYPRVEWQQVDSLSDSVRFHKASEIASDWDVVIVSIDLIEPIAIAESIPNNTNKGVEQVATVDDRFFRSRIRNDQIGVLWDWTSQGSSSLALATELGLSGVISDPSSLRHWLQVCMRRGTVRMQPAHPLLQNIFIPSLATSPLSTLER